MKAENRTKREQAEELHLKGEIPFKTLIDLAPIAISISRYGIGIYANLKFLELFGLQSIDDYVGRPTHEFFAPQCQAEIKEFIRLRALGLPVPKDYEMIGLRADGSQFPMQIVVDRVNLADGPANISFATDISDRKRAAEALRESEQRYRSIFEGVQDAIFVESLDGRILDVNPRACELFGYTRQQFLTKRVAELVPSQDKIVPFNIYEPPTVPTLPVETVNVRANGEEFPVELTIRLQIYNGEQVYCVVLRDISERKRAEEQIHYQARLLEDVSDAIVSTDNEFKIVSWNRSAEKLYGWPVHEVIGQVFSQIVPIKYIHLEQADVLAEFQKKGIWNGEVIQQHRNGKTFNVLVSVTALLDQHGNRTGAIAINRDITERKKTEQALQISEQSARRAAEQLQMVHQMSATIAAGLDLNQIFQRLYEQCRQIGDTDTFYVALYDDTTWILSFPFYYSNGKFQAGPSRDIREIPGLSGYIIQHRCTLYSTDKATSLSIYTPNYQIDDLTQSFVGVPLILNERVVGVLSMQSNQPDAYSPEQIHILELLATQAAIAIQKARLFEEARQEISERKQMEEALAESQALLNSIVESTNDMIWAVEPESFGLLLFNGGLGDYFLHNSGMRIKRGMRPEDLFPTDEYVQKWRGFYQQALKAGSYSTDYTVYAGTSTLHLSLNVLKRNGMVFGISVFGRDITERKRVETELKQSRQQLRAFGQHLQVAREEERSSIAREIHDELGQQLTALKMDLAWLSGHILPEQTHLIQRTVAMSEMVDSTIQTVRRVASELRPGMLDDLGLSAALEWQAGEFQARTGIVCKLNLPMDVVEIDRDQATALFRIFQEALTNISRHSRATKVRVVLKKRPDSLDFAIRDNGIGILESQISNPRSLGLTGMRERVYAFGGTLRFKSAAGKGTAVYVAMPLVKKQVLKVP